jgi:hypothetical protein
MAHAQKPDFVFRQNGRVHLNRPGGGSVQSTTGSGGVRISGSNAGYTMFRGSVKSTGYPLHSPVSPFLPLPCVTVCHHISTGLYYFFNLGAIWVWVFNATPRQIYPLERPGTHYLVSWVGPKAGLDWCRKSRPPTGIRSRDRPVRSEVLYWLIAAALTAGVKTLGGASSTMNIEKRKKNGRVDFVHLRKRLGPLLQKLLIQ